MARRRQFKHNIWLKVGQLERAIVTYYSEKYQRPQAGVIRGLIKQYAEADLHFDPSEFSAFVEAQIVPEALGDEQLATEIQDRVTYFVRHLEARRGRDGSRADVREEPK